MAPNISETALAQDLIRIHKVITRALYTGLIKGTEYLQSGLPEAQLLQGYASYIHCFTEVLRSHHNSEDLIAFPAFIKVIPSAPYGQLTIDHHTVERFLIPIPQAIMDLAGKTPEQGLSVIVESLRKLSGLWEPHMLLEEHFFSRDALNAALPPEEQKRIGEAVAKHSQEHSTPPFLVVPFILYNLEPDERAIMAKSIPPVIIDQLIPITWKEQWAPMQPFLLN